MITIVALVVAGAIVGIDQLSKYLVGLFFGGMKNIDNVVPVNAIPKLLNITYISNRGAAFGSFEGMQWLFILLTSAALIAIIVYMLVKMPKSKLLNFSFAFILGGGIGNLIDRISYGYVVDFLSLTFFSPICNIADYFVTAGTIMFLVYIMFFSDYFKNEKEKLRERKKGNQSE